MTTIYVICEGQTEAAFVRNILNKALGYDCNTCIAPIVNSETDKKTGKTYKGGIQKFVKVDNDIQHTLRNIKKPKAIVTTMFDYYALPADFPGMVEAEQAADVYEKIEIIESALKTYYYEKYPYIKFIPYIQLHEFETLLFTNIGILEEEFFDRINKKEFDSLVDFVNNEDNIELINSGTDTAPSKRIIKCIQFYHKPIDGMKILSKIDFLTIWDRCKHFNDWITKLENND